MTLKEKIGLIKSSGSQEILNGGGHNGTPLLKYVYEVHQEVFGTACKSCSSLIPKYIAKIKSINTNIMSKERKYRMKSGSVIRINGTNTYYSDLNITDEIAEKLLKQNPNRKVLFSKMPAAKANKPSAKKAIHELKLKDFEKEIKKIDSLEQLNEIEEAEKNAENRKGAFELIEDRKKEIQEKA